MKKQLFPKEILENTYEVHQFKYSKRSQKIYLFLLFLLLGALLSLPFIKVNIYTSVRGVIKPQEERIPLRINQQGQVIYSILRPHQLVHKGDTLLRLAHPVLDEKKTLLSEQLAEHQAFITDLQQLIATPQQPTLLTPRFKKQWLLFKESRAELNTRFKQASFDFNRDKSLFEKGVIAQIEFNKTQLAYDLAKNALAQLQQRMMAQWETELHDFEHEQDQLQSNLKQLQQNQPQFILTAVSTGTLLILEGVPVGSWVFAGQQLGELSPNGNLIVEAYVPTHKIGEIHPQAEVKFQIDAYNYQQWGTVKGEIQRLGKDVELLNNVPVFKLQCSLAQDKVSLPNGVQAHLQKGLTLTALFYQNRRSLYDLLFDDINDWMNPNQP